MRNVSLIPFRAGRVRKIETLPTTFRISETLRTPAAQSVSLIPFRAGRVSIFLAGISDEFSNR